MNALRPRTRTRRQLGEEEFKQRSLKGRIKLVSGENLLA